ncbi:hypothetical protein QBC43DRAFT_250609 [Cladorrhinum sp. PSN259]|nr:hypothetical protein QBC43DRAFT_250609 [Cladorrhinum sp. PSN259]
MPSFKNIILILVAISSTTLAGVMNLQAREVSDTTSSAKPVACGSTTFVFTGLPPNHPLVTKEGFDPAVIDKALHADQDAMTAAGYNVRIVLFGPEEPVSTLDYHMRDIQNWDGTGVGYGVRVAHDDQMTIRFEDIISLYRQRAAHSPIIFNSSPTSGFLPAIQRRFPIVASCANTPGKNLGYRVICSKDVCKN